LYVRKEKRALLCGNARFLLLPRSLDGFRYAEASSYAQGFGVTNLHQVTARKQDGAEATARKLGRKSEVSVRRQPEIIGGVRWQQDEERR